MKTKILAALLVSNSLLFSAESAPSPTPAPTSTPQDIASKVVDRAVKGKKVPKAEVDSAVLSATEMAEALATTLSQTADLKNARVININIHVGDSIITLGFDEGIDAEEWGMVDNQTEGGAAATSGNATTKPKSPHNGPGGKKKIEVRKGNLIILATEEEKRSPTETAQSVPAHASPSPTDPATNTTAP